MEKMHRQCPLCKTNIEYKSPISYKKSLKENKPCRCCAAKERANRPEEKIRLQAISKLNVGEKNHFFGKRHTLETKNKIKTKLKGVNLGSNGGMYGKSFYDIWVDKYGVEEANKRLSDFKNKQTINQSGVKNPMYGKPSPIGSGNGWSGWYNGWYFRSLRELTFMVNVIERFGFEWETGESNKWKIKYVDYNGSERNYFPDFILNNKYMIECKPKRLWNSYGVSRKKEVAIEFCGNNGLKYKLVDYGTLSVEKIKNMYETGIIKFIKKYEQKYKETYST